MRRTFSMFLVAALSTLSFSAFADETDTKSAPTVNAGAAIAPSGDRSLSQIHAGTTSQSTTSSGQSREIDLSATKTAQAKAARPAASPRVLRKMNAEHAMAAIDPAIRACAAASTTAAATSFALRLSVAPNGDVEASEPANGARVAAPVLACVTKAVASAHFGAPGAAGAAVVLPVTVPGHPAEESASATVAAR